MNEAAELASVREEDARSHGFAIGRISSHRAPDQPTEVTKASDQRANAKKNREQDYPVQFPFSHETQRAGCATVACMRACTHRDTAGEKSSL